MAKFPALPASVDRYVREIINRMLGRTGNAGDRVVLQEDLVELGLAIEKGQKLSQPVSISGTISDTMTPVSGVEPPDNPTTASHLSAAGIFGAVILQWKGASYNGHSHTEVWRAQVDDREQASMVHEASGTRYSDVTGSTLNHYYWIRYANRVGQTGGFNALNGVMGAGTPGTEHIQEQVKGVIDNSYFSEDWASYTSDQEALTSEAHDRIDVEISDRIASIKAEKDAQAYKNAVMKADISMAEISADNAYGYAYDETRKRIAEIQSEQVARIDGDTALGSQIDTVIANLSTETANRVALVQSEQTARVDEDAALGSRVDLVLADLSTETASRIAAVQSEQTARVNADSSLGQRVDTVVADLSTETDSRIAAVQSEQSARTNADTSLDGKITVEAQRIDAVIADLSTEVEQRGAAVLSEQQARVTADSGLQGAIEAEAIRVDSAIAGVANETIARQAAITSEQQARITADNGIQGEIEVEASRIDTVIADLSSETSTRQSAITSVQQAIVDGDNAIATDITTLTSTINQNTASITTQQTVTDGLKAEYTLKVRHESNGQITVAGIGVASGQAEDGQPFSEIAFAAEHFFFTTPDGLTQPLSIVNIGTEAAPNYQVMLDANVMISGQLSISQLQSGELQNGTALTVGQGSIEMSTASDGYGQIVITGAGGVATNDYLVIKEGRIESFVYTASAGHVRYKEVRRNESGAATSGQQVTIPAYFKSQPEVHLSPHDINIYNADYPTQSQRLELEHSVVLPHPDIEGAWVFTPYCRLLLSDGGKTVTNGLTYVGGNTSQRWEVTGVNALKGVTINGRAASSRRTGSGNSYQNRKVTMALQYRSPGGSWISGGSTTVNISQFNTHGLQMIKSLSTGTYDLAVVLTAQDRSGTFTSGAVEYEYTTFTRPHNSMTLTDSDVTTTQQSQDIKFSLPKMSSSWEMTKVVYTATVKAQGKARTGYFMVWEGFYPTWYLRLGFSELKYRNGASTLTFLVNSNAGAYSPAWATEQDLDTTLTIEDSSQKTGVLSNFIQFKKSEPSADSHGDNYYNTVETGYLAAQITNIQAVFHYRRVKSQSTASSNKFYWDSSRYDLGATDVSITDSIIHWTATGE